MSVLTANTLFHFAGKEDKVKGKQALLSILESGFRPSYCREFGAEEMKSSLTGQFIKEMNVPMVCFCDLPLSKLNKHIATYGHYGLGMSKDWGQRKGLNPVNYITPDSHLVQSVLRANSMMYILYEKLHSDSKVKSNTELEDMFKYITMADVSLESFNSVISYLKPYRSLTKGITYYDEREWRYVVPPRPEGNKTPILSTFIVDLAAALAEAKQILWKDHSRWLPFNHPDIKYIIVNDDSDIEDVLKHLKKVNTKHPGKYNKKAIDSLHARILTSKQIHEDF